MFLKQILCANGNPFRVIGQDLANATSGVRNELNHLINSTILNIHNQFPNAARMNWNGTHFNFAGLNHTSHELFSFGHSAENFNSTSHELFDLFHYGR